MSKIELEQGDCLKLLKGISSNTIDLICTDPPYKYNLNKLGERGNSKWQKNRLGHLTEILQMHNGFNPLIIKEMIRVMKHINLYIWCSKEQLLPLLDLFVHHYHCYYTIITWHKTNPLPFTKNKYLSDTEYCLFFHSKGVHINGNYHSKFTYYVSPINTKDKRKWHHPTIKPLKIIKNQIINSSKKNDIVLDPFIGSGTTAVACQELDRNCIGMEINPQYIQIARQRIKEN